MPTIAQVRGMLLEEALLYLLRFSGYKTIINGDNDPTIVRGPSGFEVRGRGLCHQIDAIADFSISPPFSYPQRLLVEAKCYAKNKPIGIDVVRNAVGVLKDVSEYWTVNPTNLALQNRFHYQYAVFSASGYTIGTKQYSFAQDIYLIPLQESEFIQPIIQAIRDYRRTSFGISMGELRNGIRQTLLGVSHPEWSEANVEVIPSLAKFFDAFDQVKGALLGMILGRFPIFLVSNPDVNIGEFDDVLIVKVYKSRDSREKGWFLTSGRSRLFSFDLPPALVEMINTEDSLTMSRLLDFKEHYLNRIQAFYTTNDTTRLITFNLDMDWIEQVRIEGLKKSQRKSKKNG